MSEFGIPCRYHQSFVLSPKPRRFIAIYLRIVEADTSDSSEKILPEWSHGFSSWLSRFDWKSWIFKGLWNPSINHLDLTQFSWVCVSLESTEMKWALHVTFTIRFRKAMESAYDWCHTPEENDWMISFQKRFKIEKEIFGPFNLIHSAISHSVLTSAKIEVTEQSTIAVLCSSIVERDQSFGAVSFSDSTPFASGFGKAKNSQHGEIGYCSKIHSSKWFKPLCPFRLLSNCNCLHPKPQRHSGRRWNHISSVSRRH
jgi:hypothetical protein